MSGDNGEGIRSVEETSLNERSKGIRKGRRRIEGNFLAGCQIRLDLPVSFSFWLRSSIFFVSLTFDFLFKISFLHIALLYAFSLLGIYVNVLPRNGGRAKTKYSFSDTLTKEEDRQKTMIMNLQRAT